MEREAKREEKKELAATKLMLKEARLEAERLAQEEEDRAVEGLDELEMVLRRQELRTKVRLRESGVERRTLASLGCPFLFAGATIHAGFDG